MIGFDEKEKSMDEAISFNKDNIFEYLFYILQNRNANWYGTKSDDVLKELYEFIEKSPILKDNVFDIEDFVTRALVQTSQYAYEAGFKEACKLHKTLHSF